MPAPVINVGATANDGTGDTLRAAFIKVNQVVQYAEAAAEDAADSAAAAAAAAIDGLDAIYNGTIIIANASDKSAEIAAANAIGKPILFIGPVLVTTPTTITVPIVDQMRQIFDTAAQVTIDNGQPVRPEWWGAGQNTIDLAIKSLPVGGGVVQLEFDTYLTNNYFYGTSGVGSGKYISKANVSIVGRKMPQLANDCKALTGGTIIQGSILAFADNFEMRDLGVDRGFTVSATATVSDAIVCTYPDNVTKAAAALKRGLRLHNVIGLANGPTDLVHAVIAGEGYSDVTCTGEVVGCYGVHGVVFKAAEVKAEQVSAYGNGSNGVVIKTDTQATAASSSVQIGHIRSYAGGPPNWAPYAVSSTGTGVFFHCFGGDISKVQIDSILESGHANGVLASFDGAFTLDNVQIGRITTDANSSCGTAFVAGAAQKLSRCQITDIVARNTPVALALGWQADSSFQIGTLHAVNCSTAAVLTSGIADPVVGRVIAENCGAAHLLTGSGHPRIGMQMLKGSTGLTYQPAGGGQTVALANGWTQVGANDLFGVVLSGYGIELQGLVQPGSSNIVCVLPAALRPTQNKRYMVQGYNGTAVVAVPLVVAATGEVKVNEVGGGTANCSSWLSLAGVFFAFE